MLCIRLVIFKEIWVRLRFMVRDGLGFRLGIGFAASGRAARQ